MNQITLPCIDAQCELCVQMWGSIKSRICRMCYAGFTCPKVARDSPPHCKLNDKDRSEANSNLHKIEDEIPLAILRTGPRMQRADMSKSDKDDARDESPDQADDGETAPNTSLKCTYCQKEFSCSHRLRHHVGVHTTRQFECSICGKVFSNSRSSYHHEMKHLETDAQRDQRLKLARRQKWPRDRSKERGRRARTVLPGALQF